MPGGRPRKKSHQPQTLGPSRAKRVVAENRTFTHLRVWKATHKKLRDLATANEMTLAEMTAELVDSAWVKEFL